MIATRTTTITHQLTGTQLQTPLLIPSFSSRGLRDNELRYIFNQMGELLDRTYLISAFDVYHKLLPGVDLLPCYEFIYFDSGGYETSESQDLSSAYFQSSSESVWTENMLKSIYDSIPEEIPAVLVSYDNHDNLSPIDDQISNASRLLRNYPNQLKLLLLKPEQKNQDLSIIIGKISNNIQGLAEFDIIGITEKEIGTSILDRMTNISKLRNVLDKANISAPIHVFGALDPLSVCLYYMAGAEIFDGLTWLRYGYRQGLCSYIHNHGALEHGIHLSKDRVESIIRGENYLELCQIQMNLSRFFHERDFSIFEHSIFLMKSYKMFEDKMREERRPQ